MNNDVGVLGTILGVWAHPDDETFMVGGLLHMAASNGQNVVCVTATKGEGGIQNEVRWPAASLGKTRAKELGAALEILGVTNHHWLDYSDGDCSNADSATAIERIVALIEQYKPNSIVTFAPDGLTGHDDHRAVSGWALAAAEQGSVKPEVWYAVHTQELYDNSFSAIHDKFNVYFNIDVPKFVVQENCDLLLQLPDNVLDKKLAALQAMPSQYEAFFAGMIPGEAELAFETEGLVLASKWEAL